MQITRLRVSGFKSFGEPVELLIETGLTGVVGPNGCGKSNLVEALRWVMGESSARGLRGDEMDDVIFSGSAGRAAFDVAEVTLRLRGPLPLLGLHQRRSPGGLAPRPYQGAMDREIRASGDSMRPPRRR